MGEDEVRKRGHGGHYVASGRELREDSEGVVESRSGEKRLSGDARVFEPGNRHDGH